MVNFFAGIIAGILGIIGFFVLEIQDIANPMHTVRVLSGALLGSAVLHFANMLREEEG